MLFLPAVKALSICRVFHSANISELEEALASKPSRRGADRDAPGNEERFTGKPSGKGKPALPAKTPNRSGTRQSFAGDMTR
jgi:hypothetical protein